LETTPDQPIPETGSFQEVITSEKPDLKKAEETITPQTRPMRWLWIYLLVAAVVLPLLLLRPFGGAIEVLLAVVLISLIAVGVEAELRPSGFGRTLRTAISGVRLGRRTKAGTGKTAQIVEADQAASNTEEKAKALERERLLFLAGSLILAVIAALLYNRSTNRLDNWQGATGFMLASFASMGAAVVRWRELAGLSPAHLPGSTPDPEAVPAATDAVEVIPAAVSTAALPAFAEPTPNALSPSRSNAALTALGVGFLLVLAEINGQAFDIPVLKGVPYWLQAFLFYGGMTLTAFGLGGVTLRVPSIQWPRREVWLLFALFVFAFVVRLHQLDWLRASFDEAIPINAIVSIWNPNDSIGIVTQPSSYVTTLVFSQWQALAVGIFGKNIIGLRIFSVFIGALSVVFIALLARDLFDRRTGWIAGLLLAVFPPHVHFSRIALLHIADPFVGMLAIWFVVRGIRFNRRVDWALAGIFLGLTQYFFEAGRLFFIPLVVIWIVGMLVLWRGRLRTQWHGFVVMALALIFTALPAYYTLFARESTGISRLSSSALDSSYWSDALNRVSSASTRDQALTELVSRVLFPFQIFVRQPEMAIFYGGEQPMLLVYLVPFFLLGLFYLLWRLHPAALIAFGWPVATAVVNILMRDQAHYPRWVVGMSGMVLAAAVGFRYVLPGLIPQMPLVREEQRAPLRRGMRAVATVLLVGLVVGQLVYYHRDHVPFLMRQIRLQKPDPDTIDAALRVPDLPLNTDIYFVSSPIADIHPPRAWINFLTPPSRNPLEGYRLFVMTTEEFTPGFLAGLSTSDRNFAFFIQSTDTVSNALLKHTFTSVRAKDSPYPIDPPSDEFILYSVPKGVWRY
jgi:hypothetical protein